MNLKTVITENALAFQNEECENLAILRFEVQDDVLIITHTNVSEVLRGQGIAGKLMNEFYDYASKNGKKVRNLCSYAVDWFKKHPEKADILADIE